MAISPLGAISTGALSNAAPLQNATKVAGTSGDSFGDVVSKAIDSLQQTQTKADNLAAQAATGDLTDVHDYMIASTQANLATELTVAVRNKAVDAFNDIMRMSL
jgi:flagellar hook-basal body complex protein FliE